MSLHALQSEFVDLIFSNEPGSDQFPSIEGLAIYRHNIYAHLTRMLHYIYPLIVRLIGKDYFLYLAKTYIEQYPSCDSNLNQYGEYFSHFLSEYVALKSLAYLPEIAKFEWMSHQLYFAADAVFFDLTKLNDLAPDQYDKLRLLLHPAACVVTFNYPILRIKDFCQTTQETLLPVEKEKNYLLLFRQANCINTILLTQSAYCFLEAIQNGCTLFEALQMTLQVDETFSLSEHLVNWVRQQIIVGIEMLF